MKLSFIRRIVEKLLALRGLRISPQFTYGISLASDIKKLWLDLDLGVPHTIVDIGANVGNFSREINNYFKQARILAVEPNTDLLKVLTRIPGLEVVDAAISASSGAAMLNIYNVNGIEDTPLSSLTKINTFADLHDLAPTRQIQVRTATLDDLAAKHNLKFIDILKIDVEGLELDVLMGGASLLASHKIGLIAIEWSTRVQDKHASSTIFSLLEAMNKWGYLPASSSVDWCKAKPVYINNNMIFIASTMLTSANK